MKKKLSLNLYPCEVGLLRSSLKRYSDVYWEDMDCFQQQDWQKLMTAFNRFLDQFDNEMEVLNESL